MNAQGDPSYFSMFGEKARKFSGILDRRIDYHSSEIVKYAAASLLVFLPSLSRYVYYFNLSCLLTFLTLFCACFSVLMFTRPKRKWLIPFMLAGLFGVGYQIGVGKPLGYQTLSSMYETNVHEILGFFLAKPLFLLLIPLILVPVWFFLQAVVDTKPLPGFDRRTFIRLKYLLPLPIFSMALFFITQWEICETYPVCLFYNNFMYIDENIAIRDYKSARHSFLDEYTSHGSDETFILVIGEAARRRQLSAYGYREKSTSPELDRVLRESSENVVLFKDAISSSAYTRASVMSIYSPLYIDELRENIHTKPGLSKIFRSANFETLYATTRPKYTIPNMLSTFLDDADEQIYLKRKHDDALIPEVQSFMRRKKGGRFIVVHLMGSHIKYDMQYPKDFRPFEIVDKMRDTYDTSIRYTDKVLQGLVDLIMQDENPSCLLYVSDHGENLNDTGDGNYGHGTKGLTIYELEVPFVVYLNDSFIARRKHEVDRLRSAESSPVCHDNVSHSLMGLAGIKDPAVYRAEADISSPEFLPLARKVSDENMEIFEFASIDFSKPRPIREFTQKIKDKYLDKFKW